MLRKWDNLNSELIRIDSEKLARHYSKKMQYENHVYVVWFKQKALTRAETWRSYNSVVKLHSYLCLDT